MKKLKLYAVSWYVLLLISLDDYHHVEEDDKK